MATKQTKLSVLLTMNSKQFNSAMSRAMFKMNKAGKRMQSTGKMMTRNLSLPIALVGAAAVKMAADFEFSMAKVQAVSGFTAKEMAGLETQAKQLGASTSKSASDVASLQLELAKLGNSSTQIKEMTESILSLAIAFDAELGEAAMTVGTTLSQFGLEASESGRVADVMAAAFGGSALDIENFGEAMKNAGPVANEFGFSLEETTALLGTLADSGIKGADAGTKLKMGLSQLAAAGPDVKKTFMGLIDGSVTYADAIEKLGKRAAILIPILGKNGVGLDNLREKLKNSAGAAKAARLVLEDTSKGGFDRMKSAAEAAGIEIGNGLLPAVDKVAKAIAGFASKLAGMTREQRDSKIKTMALVAAIGPMVFVLGKAVTGLVAARKAMLALNAAMLTNPYFLAAAAIVAVVVAMKSMRSEQTLSQKIQNTSNDIAKKTNSLMAEEAAKVKVLAMQYKLAKGNAEKRQEYLDKLKAINPDIVKGIDAESTSYEDLTKSIDSYLEKLKEKIRQKLLEKELTAQIQDQIKLEQQLATAQLANAEAEEKIASGAAKRMQVYISKGGLATEVLSSTGAEALSSQKTIDRLSKSLQDNAAQQDALAKGIVTVSTAQATANAELEEAERKEKALTKAREDHRKKNEEWQKGEDARLESLAKEADLIDEIISGMQAEMDAREAANKARQDMELGDLEDISLGSMDPVDDEDIVFSKIEDRALKMRNVMEDLKKNWVSTGEQMGQAMAQAIGPMSDIFADLIMGAEGAEEAFKKLGMSLLKQLLSIAIGNLIASAMSPLDPTNAVTGGVSGVTKAVAAPAIVGGLFGAVPAFAEGGAVLGPTLALVGEKAGSAGEAIIPFEKMTEFARKAIDTDSLGGGSNVTVTGRISGSSIAISNKRGSRARSRY